MIGQIVQIDNTISQLLEGIDILQEDQLKDSLQQLLSMIVKCPADKLIQGGEM
ncbi:MAG: hypothetical protein EZS28_049470, partial [Streblomastix strix]